MHVRAARGLTRHCTLPCAGMTRGRHCTAGSTVWESRPGKPGGVVGWSCDASGVASSTYGNNQCKPWKSGTYCPPPPLPPLPSPAGPGASCTRPLRPGRGALRLAATAPPLVAGRPPHRHSPPPPTAATWPCRRVRTWAVGALAEPHPCCAAQCRPGNDDVTQQPRSPTHAGPCVCAAWLGCPSAAWLSLAV